jgi:hypothetical protein
VYFYAVPLPQSDEEVQEGAVGTEQEGVVGDGEEAHFLFFQNRNATKREVKLSRNAKVWFFATQVWFFAKRAGYW